MKSLITTGGAWVGLVAQKVAKFNEILENIDEVGL